MRAGDWMQTYTGQMFYPLDPRVEDVCIEDIAHALSRQCRYAGHCREFYSVAEHSVRVSWLCGDDAMAGLLHDAAEAYIVDVPRPLKHAPEMAGYRLIEKRVHEVVCERFAVSPQELAVVRKADEVLLATEARDLMVMPPADWHLAEKPMLVMLDAPWSPDVAEREFLDAFEEYTAR